MFVDVKVVERLTTYNHTATAALAVCAVQDQPIAVKVVVGVVLVITHPLFDMMPHQHWYDFAKIRRSRWHQLGALIELGGGGIVLPLALVWLFGISQLWLGVCYVLAASAFDFAVIVESKLVGEGKRRWIAELNNRAHFWQHGPITTSQIFWELGQTVILFSLLWFVFVRGAP